MVCRAQIKGGISVSRDRVTVCGKTLILFKKIIRVYGLVVWLVGGLVGWWFGWLVVWLVGVVMVYAP